MTDVSGGRPPFDDPAPALLDVARLAARGIEVVAETASTNAVLAERVRAGRGGAEEGAVLVTEHQSAGRGRLDRGWTTPPRTALTFSLVWRPSVEPASWPWLPLLVGHVVAKTLTGAGFAARVKWPNDVLLGDRKVAGILVERVEGPGAAAAVVGVGLNVAMPPESLPVPTATSLLVEAQEHGTPLPDRTDLLVRLVDALTESYDAWQAGGAAGQERLRSSYAAGCDTLGRSVSVALPDGTELVGEAVDVDPSGRLVVRPGAGEPVAVAAGDVVHVRRTG